MTMFLPSLTLVLVFCINDLVSGQLVRAKPPVFECAFHQCPDVVSDCDRLRSYRHCCSICPNERRCFHNGKWYESGTSFKDSCNSCFCSNGLVRCTMRACPILDLPCFYKGKLHPHGSSFKDDCNKCTCSQGKVTCTKKGCGKGCFHKGKHYKNGASFNDGCNSCTCSQGKVTCTKKGCGCVYKGKKYIDGASFKDDCNTCNCRQGIVGCTKIGCPPKKCTYNGKIYKEGQMIPSKDPCTTCHCRKGIRDCSVMMCPHVYCPRQRKFPGECCPFCEDLTI